MTQGRQGAVLPLGWGCTVALAGQRHLFGCGEEEFVSQCDEGPYNPGPFPPAKPRAEGAGPSSADRTSWKTEYRVCKDRAA